MAEKKAQESLEKKVEKLEQRVDQLFAFLKQQAYVKSIGGEVLGSYPVEE